MSKKGIGEGGGGRRREEGRDVGDEEWCGARVVEGSFRRRDGVRCGSKKTSWYAQTDGA